MLSSVQNEGEKEIASCARSCIAKEFGIESSRQEQYDDAEIGEDLK